MRYSWVLFGVSLLYVVYIIIGYPAGLALLARVRSRRVARRPITPSVSFVIAVHNGAAFLRQKLNSILGLDYPQDRIEIIVVDDGSTDDTEDIAASFGRRVQVVKLPKVGKASALNAGMHAASGEIIVLTDVRQVLDPGSLAYLMENFADPQVGVVSAELHILAGSTSEEADTGAYWKFERWVRLNLSSIDSIFGATGAYYAIRRELIVDIPQHTLNDDMYLPLNAFFKGYRLIVDARARMFDYPTSLSTERKRKVRTLAGNYQLLYRYPQLLTPKNRLLLHYVSYKLGRLFLPFALLVCAISSLAAGGVLAILSAVFQVCGYSIALLDPRIPPSSPLKRISSPLRTFFTIMIAAACAISIWFVPAERFWKTTKVSQPVAGVR